MSNCHFRICSKEQEYDVQRYTNLSELHKKILKKFKKRKNRARKSQNFKIDLTLSTILS